MARNLTPSPALLCFFVLLSSLHLDGISGVANEEPLGQVWCVAKPSASELELKNNIEYACVHEGMDCSLIQPGGSCSNPNTTINYASVVMNLYFQKNGRYPHNCDFFKTGLISLTNPSYGDCNYYSSA